MQDEESFLLISQVVYFDYVISCFIIFLAKTVDSFYTAEKGLTSIDVIGGYTIS